MKIRTPVLAALATTALFAVPVASQASTYQTALNACVKAFMSTAFADKEPMKVVDISQSGTTLMPTYTRSYSFTLTAIGGNSGKRLAQTTCTTDKAGSVTIEEVE